MKRLSLLLMLTTLWACSSGDSDNGLDGVTNTTSGNETVLAVGTAAPDFSLPDRNGDAVSLSSLRGKPVFLNFWATWCGPCVVEMPSIQQLHEEMGEQVQVIGVNIQEPVSTVTGFVDRHHYTWRQLLDTGGTVMRSYGISAIPTTLVIGADGKVESRHVGAMTLAQMKQMIGE